jgi:comEA protein
MDTKRFIILMSSLTAFFSVLIVVFNFISQPPFGNINVAATGAYTSSVNINSLFISDSSALSSASSIIQTQSSSQILISSQGTSNQAASSQQKVSSKVQKVTPNNPVNINTATIEQLDTVPDIGPVLAQRIIDYRTQNGNFTSIDQLDNVKDIGIKTIENMRPYITIG